MLRLFHLEALVGSPEPRTCHLGGGSCLLFVTSSSQQCELMPLLLWLCHMPLITPSAQAMGVLSPAVTGGVSAAATGSLVWGWMGAMGWSQCLLQH